MLFNSLNFILIFFPFFFIIYYLFKKNLLISVYLIIITSLCFYFINSSEWIWLLLLSVFSNTFFAKFIKKKYILFLSIFFNLTILFYYKYFFLFDQDDNGYNLLIPLGISFFTFNQIIVLIDLYFGKIKEFKFKNFFLLIIFFPHLIAGPFLRYKPIISQFETINKIPFSTNKFSFGLFLFVMGLAKKVLIADTLGFYADSFQLGIQNGHIPTFVQSWLGTFSFTLQIYFDFSGYTDMAIGLGLMIGIILPYNFKSPLKSGNIIEFWDRWHITLTSIIREFIYYPITVLITKKTKSRNFFMESIFLIIVPIMITFFIIGFWHGGTLNYIMFGVYNGILVCITYILKNYINKNNVKIYNFLKSKYFNILILNLFVNFGFVIFRTPNIKDSFLILKGMFGMNGFGVPYSVYEKYNFLKFLEPGAFMLTQQISSLTFIFIFFISYYIAIFCKNYNYAHNFHDEKYYYNFSNKEIFTAAILFVLSILFINRESFFIYFNF